MEEHDDLSSKGRCQSRRRFQKVPEENTGRSRPVFSHKTQVGKAHPGKISRVLDFYYHHLVK